MLKRSITIFAVFFGLAVSALAQQRAAIDTAALTSRQLKDSVAVKAAVADSMAKAPSIQPEQKFWKGWFGELNATAGTTAIFASELDPLKTNRGFLFNGSALVSAWSDKDQFTVAAGGNNINESSYAYDGSAESSKTDDGITTTAQAGANWFTTRIKDVESTAGLNYIFSTTDTGTSSELNEFQEEEFMSTRSNTSGNKKSHSVTLDGSLKKDKGNIVFNVKPVFRFVNTSIMDDSNTQTMSGHIEEIPYEEWQKWQEEQQRMKEEQERWMQEEKAHMSEEEWVQWQQEMQYHNQEDSSARMTRRGWAYYSNHSKGNNVEEANSFTSQLNANMTLKKLAGKKGRNLRFTLAGGYDAGGGTRVESSELWTNNSYESRMMYYDINSRAARLGGSVNYTEPIGDAWTVSALVDVAWTRSSSARNAVGEAGLPDESYSSVSNANTVKQLYDLTAQYRINQQNLVSLGARLNGLLNETFSKSKGVEEITGAGDWNWFVTPTAQYQYNKGIDRVTVALSGYNQRPGTAQMLPVMDMRTPSRPFIGNIYLKPYSSSTLNASWTRSNKERASNLTVTLLGGLNFNQISSARWYDAHKVQYAVPVNSRKPGFSTTLKANYSTPLDAAKAWTLLVSGSAAYNTSVSYQAASILPGPDKNNFDYSAFMEDFWGTDGSNFYGGVSGFQESNTQTFVPSANLSVKYNLKRFNAHVGASATGRVARYSLNPAVDMNTLDTRLYACAAYTTPHDFKLMSSFAYLFYAGYTEGFGLPEYQWNAEVGKKWGDFVFSFKAFDILNQTRSLSHSVTANYEEDTYRLTMGRYFLLGVKWCFGKAGAPHNQRARGAMKAMGL